jgi:hypothetical protein
MNTINLVNIKSYLFTGKMAKSALMLLLVLLNLVIRLPSIPHEKGYDSVFIHSLANSISIYGDAQWWVNWLSVFGFYAYSYASAVPFTLSGMQQTMGIEMELIVLIYCVITGILSIFTAYVLAGRIFSSFIFKYCFAFLFSIAPGVMLFTTWEVSSRGLFIVILPLFIYLLISNIDISKKVALVVVLLLFQFSIHHYAFVLIPIMVVYLSLLFVHKSKYSSFLYKYSVYVIPFILFVFIMLPFFSRSLVSSGSRYGWLLISAKTLLRQTGPLLFISVAGYVSTLFKRNISSTELFLLVIFTLFIPAIYSHTYGAYLLLVFLIFLMSVALFNVTKIPNKKILTSLIVILMILSTVIFTNYYNHYRTGSSDSYWYMGDDTYMAGAWGKTYVPDNSYGLDTAFETTRVFAISAGHPITPTIGAGNLAYGFINESGIEYVKVSFLDKDFYFEGPYVVKGGTTVAGSMEWIRQSSTTDINDLRAFDYFVQDTYYHKPVMNVVSQYYNKIYDNPRVVMWYYNHES